MEQTAETRRFEFQFRRQEGDVSIEPAFLARNLNHALELARRAFRGEGASTEEPTYPRAQDAKPPAASCPIKYLHLTLGRALTAEDVVQITGPLIRFRRQEGPAVIEPTFLARNVGHALKLAERAFPWENTGTEEPIYPCSEDGTPEADCPLWNLHLTLGRALTPEDIVCVVGPFTLADERDRVGEPDDDLQDYALMGYLAAFEPSPPARTVA